MHSKIVKCHNTHMECNINILHIMVCNDIVNKNRVNAINGTQQFQSPHRLRPKYTTSQAR